MIDYEKPLIKSIKVAFPSATVQGYYYHFTQAVWRSIQANGLASTYQQDASFALFMKHVTAITFVPETEVVNVFEEILQMLLFEWLSQQTGISQWSLGFILHMDLYFAAYKIQTVRDLQESDKPKCIEACQFILEGNRNNLDFVNQLFMSDEARWEGDI